MLQHHRGRARMTHAVLQLTKSAGGRLTRTFFAAAAFVLLAAALSPAAEPAVIISVKGFDELLSDVGYLGEVINQPQVGGLAQAIIGQMTGGQGLKGLDGSKPIGAYVTLSPEGQPQDIVVFVPVSDQKAFAATLAILSPNTEKVGELTQYQFQINPNPVFAKAGAKYFFFSPTAESLKETADPAKLVTVPADISIEIDLTKIPDNFKELFLAQTEASANANSNPSQSEAEQKGQEAGAKLFLAGLRRLTMDTARLTLSLDINSKVKATVLDLAFAAKSGTPLAQACAGYAKTVSPFAGLVSKQTVGSYVVSTPLSTDAEGALKLVLDEGEKAGLANLPGEPAAKEAATKMLKRMAELFRMTVLRGRWDQAVVVNAVDGKLQIVSAMKLAKGDQVGQFFEEFVKNTPEAKEHVKLNVTQIGKVKVHAITLPPDEDAQKYFGTGPVHVAVNDDTAVIVLGGDSLATLKGALDRPAAPAKAAAALAPISLRVGMSKILAPLNDFNPSQIPPAIFEQSKSALEGGLDQIALEVTGQPQGLKIRLEVQEGVLRLGAIAATQNP